MTSSRCPLLNDSISSVISPKVETQKQRIDCLIRDGKEYAVIVENKINWAEDQYKQIERYVNSVKELGIPTDNIFVIYLTLNGDKKVESYSFTEKVKEVLNWTNDDSGRFIEMNYRDDIRPWLRDKILPEVKIKEKYLVSCLEQYIDYLEGRFKQRKSEMEAYEKMDKELYNKLEIKEITATSSQDEKFEALNKIDEAHNAVASLGEFLYKEKFEIRNKMLETFLSVAKEKFSDTYFYMYHDEHPYFQLFHAGWSEKLHFEWNKVSFDDLRNSRKYLFRLDDERKPTNQKNEILEAIKDVLGDFVRGEQDWVICEKYIELEKPFLQLTDQEQRDFLNKFYDGLSPIIYAIDKKIFQK